MLAAMLILLVGCAKNEFEVELDLDSKIEDNYRFVYHGSSKSQGIDVDVVVPVEKGKAVLKGVTRYPTLVYIYHGGRATPSAIFYAKRGDDIKITGDSPDPSLWLIEGNEISEQWSRWRKQHSQKLNTADPTKINNAVADFVKANPNAEVSTLLMLTSFDRRSNENLFITLWNSISSETRKDELVKLATRADRLTSGAEPTPGKIGVLKLHAMGDSLVEFKTSDRNATLIYFRRNSDKRGDNDKDTLEALTSLDKGQIAVISFESDSTAWLMRARGDSLEGKALNAWLPTAEASEEAISLRVPRTPWYIVTGKDGRQIYRGDDFEKARREYRRLAK